VALALSLLTMVDDNATTSESDEEKRATSKVPYENGTFIRLTFLATAAACGNLKF